MKDDQTGEPLTQRSVDSMSGLPKRLNAYHNETEPILDHYQSKRGCTVTSIDADRPPTLVWTDLSLTVKGKQPPKNMAFIFVKPNQVNEKVVNTVREGLTAKGLTITREGDKQIDGKKTHYFTVEWDEKDFSFADFNDKLIGATNPTKARQASLRGKICREWKKHDLESAPDASDNVVHASASPFEGLCDRMKRLGVSCHNDAYGRALLAAGVTEQTIRAWKSNPEINVTSDNGKKGSVFDALKDTGATACTVKAAELAALQ